jgi:glyoxylase-like metal-dependent hydrolase (beta-lactamase superfamily II)
MKIYHIEGYVQSIYLVEYPDKLLLLDGCCRADIPIITQFIVERLQRELSDLDTIVVTHMHPDHAGGADKLRKLTGCKLVTAKTERHWYRGISGMLMHWTDMALAIWVAGRLGKKKKNLWYWPWLKPDIMLSDSEHIPGFTDWCVIEMMGHTDRDLSVLHIPSRRIYVADLIVQVKKRYIPPFPVFYPNRYYHSILKLRELDPTSIMLAHSGEVTLVESDYEHLLDIAPNEPKTAARVVKAKLATLFGIHSLRN